MRNITTKLFINSYYINPNYMYILSTYHCRININIGTRKVIFYLSLSTFIYNVLLIFQLLMNDNIYYLNSSTLHLTRFSIAIIDLTSRISIVALFINQ